MSMMLRIAVPRVSAQPHKQMCTGQTQCCCAQRCATRCKGARFGLTCSGSSSRVAPTAAKQASVSVLSAEGPGRAPAASPMASISWAPEPTRHAKLLASDKAFVSETADVAGAVSSYRCC